MTVNALRKFEEGDDTALDREQIAEIERRLARAGVEFTNREASGVG
jgi:hypothetical protein